MRLRLPVRARITVRVELLGRLPGDHAHPPRRSLHQFQRAQGRVRVRHALGQVPQHRADHRHGVVRPARWGLRACVLRCEHPAVRATRVVLDRGTRQHVGEGVFRLPQKPASGSVRACPCCAGALTEVHALIPLPCSCQRLVRPVRRHQTVFVSEHLAGGHRHRLVEELPRAEPCLWCDGELVREQYTCLPPLAAEAARLALLGLTHADGVDLPVGVVLRTRWRGDASLRHRDRPPNSRTAP